MALRQSGSAPLAAVVVMSPTIQVPVAVDFTCSIAGRTGNQGAMPTSFEIAQRLKFMYTT